MRKLTITILLLLAHVAYAHSIPAGSTDQHIHVIAVDATDTHTRETGLSSWTVYYSINDSTPAAMTTPTLNELDSTNMPGVYTLAIDESAMTTLTAGDDTHELSMHFTHTGMDPVTRVVTVFRPKITEGQTVTAANGAVDSDMEYLQGATTNVDDFNDFLEDCYDATNDGVDVYLVRGAAPKTDSDLEANALAALEDIQLHYLLDSAIPSQPTAGSYLGDLTEDNAGTQRFTEAALAEAPAIAGAASDANETNQLAILSQLDDMSGATFSTTTDSLEAIRNRGDNTWGTATGFSTHSVADVWGNASRTLTAFGLTPTVNVTQINGTSIAGTGTQVPDAFEYFFNVATPAKTINDAGVAGTPLAAADVWAYATRSLTDFDEDDMNIDLDATIVTTGGGDTFEAIINE